MIRTALITLAIIATGATAIAAVQPGNLDAGLRDINLTVIEKNDVFPILGPIEVEECIVEDCSDTQI